MATIKKFEDLECWQVARQLVYQLYRAKPHYKHDFIFNDQIIRAAYSVMNNIAEGFGRHSNKEFARFLEIACGSCFEIKSMIYMGQDLEYFKQPIAEELFTTIDIVERKLKSLLKYLRSK